MARKFYKEDGETIPAIVFENTAPSGFTEISDPEEIKRLYVIEYNKRKTDGEQFILDFTASLYIDVLNLIYTESEVFALENHIGGIYSALKNGWWLTAQNANQNLVLLGIYTQAMKDEIQNQLDSYILNNY